MLVLSRKLGQKLLIGSDIVVTVVAVEGAKVRLGIEAPKDVAVFREEVLQKEYLGLATKKVYAEGELEKLIEGASADYAYPL